MSELPTDIPRKPFGRLTLEDLEELASKAQGLIEAARDAAIDPHHRKVLRPFTAPEVAKLCGNLTVDTFSRRLKKDDQLPQGKLVNARRREFSLEDIHTLQAAWGITPRRPPDKKPLVLSVCNFKGGVAKTTTTAHLGQYLCLHGYRTLIVDLDAQASLTQTFGILPHTEVPSSSTARPFFEGPVHPGGERNPDWTGTLASAIQKTHWHQLDLVPSNLGLYGSEFAIAGRIRSEENFMFYTVLDEALNTVKDDYDVILLDTAPSLSFVNSNALYAADALVITLPPAFLDLQSASLFYDLIADVVRSINQVQGNAEKVFEFGAILLTRFKPSDAIHQKISSWIRSFLSDTFTHAMVQTVVLEKLGPRLLTLYEVDHTEESAKYEGDRKAFERALEAMNDVNGEIERAIQDVWSQQTIERHPPSPAAVSPGPIVSA